MLYPWTVKLPILSTFRFWRNPHGLNRCFFLKYYLIMVFIIALQHTVRLVAEYLYRIPILNHILVSILYFYFWHQSVPLFVITTRIWLTTFRLNACLMTPIRWIITTQLGTVNEVTTANLALCITSGRINLALDLAWVIVLHLLSVGDEPDATHLSLALVITLNFTCVARSLAFNPVCVFCLIWDEGYFGHSHLTFRLAVFELTLTLFFNACLLTLVSFIVATKCRTVDVFLGAWGILYL